MSTPYTPLARMMRLYRMKHNLGLKEVAREVGVHWRIIENVERGGQPTSRNFAAIITWLMEPEEPRKRGKKIQGPTLRELKQ